MRIIQFKENQKEIWNNFIAENNSESFLQAWEWGSFQESLGRKIWRIGIVRSQKFIKSKVHKVKSQELENLSGISLIVKYDLPLGKSYLYCPRMMISQKYVKFIKSKVHKVESHKILFEEIRKIAKKESSLFLRFDPAALIKHKTWNMEQNFPLLAKEGLGEVAKSLNEIQPRDTLILDLTKSEEELLREMKPKTRYNIRLAMKKKLEVRNWEPPLNSLLRKEGKIENILLRKEGAGGGFRKKFEGFWKLMEETARRDNFKSHSKNYYWQMLEICRERKFSFPTNLTAKLYLAEHNKKIIAANIVLFFGDYCVYLHGASSNKYRNLMAPYLLQWRQILDAKKAGCKVYDFWGVEGSRKFIKSKVHKVESNWGGITRFKKGFGGEEKNYVGARDLVFDKFWYRIYKFIKRVKNNF